MNRRVAAVLVVLIGASVLALPASARERGRPFIVVLEPGVAAGRAGVTSLAASFGARPTFVYSHAITGYAADLTSEELATLSHDPRVAFAAPDERFRLADPCATQRPSGAAQCLPSGVDRIDADLGPAVAGDGAGSVDVNVAVIDSGIDTDHPDLNVAGGTRCAGGGTSFDDAIGHGTHVAGTIGALDDGIGVVGVAPGAALWAVRVATDQGHISASSVVCAIDWVTATRTDGDPGNDIAVANMSLSARGSDDEHCGRRDHDPVHLAICRSVRRGVTYTVAAGNEGRDLARNIPASYDEVLTVTAMADVDGGPGGTGARGTCHVRTDDDAPASFSNFATRRADRAHTVAAPGVCIWSTVPSELKGQPPGTPTYLSVSGTSMASPHAAGTVALCVAYGPCGGMTPAKIIDTIRRGARAHTRDHHAYGFEGDPDHHPSEDRSYGYLIWAGRSWT